MQVTWGNQWFTAVIYDEYRLIQVVTSYNA